MPYTIRKGICCISIFSELFQNVAFVLIVSNLVFFLFSVYVFSFIMILLLTKLFVVDACFLIFLLFFFLFDLPTFRLRLFGAGMYFIFLFVLQIYFVLSFYVDMDNITLFVICMFCIYLLFLFLFVLLPARVHDNNIISWNTAVCMGTLWSHDGYKSAEVLGPCLMCNTTVWGTCLGTCFETFC